MKVGILGTNFGAFHASIYKRHPSVETIRIWGRNREKLNALGNEMAIETTTDINDLLHDPSIHLIDVCLPSDMHREYVIRALGSGKNVFCETPLCITTEDADVIIKAEKDSGKRLFVNQFIKLIQEYRYLKEVVDDVRHGKLLVLKAWRNTAPVWGKLGNETIVSSLMMHELDLATWLFGKPEEINATARAKNDAETYVEASLVYYNALVMISASSMMPVGYPFTTGFNAIFEEATITASCSFENETPHRSVIEYTNNKTRSVELPLTDPYESAIAHVLDCCRTGKEPCISGKSAVMAVEVAVEISSMIQ